MDIQKIILLYKQGWSLSALSREYLLSTYKIRKILIENNVKIRSRVQQNFLSNQQRSYSVQENYFNDIDTQTKSWILGFLMADGSISKDRNKIKIALSTQDREILEKIRQEIKIERKILDTETNKGFAISELSWSNSHHKKQLIQYGIVPNKTYKQNHIPNISTELYYGFILGYYDGDGCFKNDGNTCRFEICSYDPTILQEIANFINNTYKVNKKVYKDKSRNNYYTITYSTKVAIAFLEDAYSKCSFYLLRKYQKFLEWKNQNKRI